MNNECKRIFLADSHCHILDPRLIDRAEDIVANLHNDGLAFIVEISASAQESIESVRFAQAHENVFCTIGVHPHFANEYSDEFEAWATTPPPVGRHPSIEEGRLKTLSQETPPSKEIQTNESFSSPLLYGGVARRSRDGVVLRGFVVVCTQYPHRDCEVVERPLFALVGGGEVYNYVADGKLVTAVFNCGFNAFFAFLYAGIWKSDEGKPRQSAPNVNFDVDDIAVDAVQSE